MRERISRRGGKRLDRYRVSYQLSRADCEKLIGATNAATLNGRPFNRFITILWEDAGIDPLDNARTTGKFIKYASDWAARNESKLTWAWVQEWGRYKGAHTHILLHIPVHLNHLFRPMPRKWVKRLIGGKYIAGAVRSDRVGRDSDATSPSQLHCSDLMTRLHYMLKYAPPELEIEFDMTWERAPYSKSWGREGRVYGKRAATWQGWREASAS